MHLREMTAHEVRDSYRAMTSPVQTPLTDRVFVGQRLTAIRKALGLNAAESCREVIARNVSTRTVFERLSAPHRLVVRCVCGAHNLVPYQKA